MSPTYIHMAVASLVSAFSWLRIGRSSVKDYLDTQKSIVLNSTAMVDALHDAKTGTPDQGKTKKRYYHHWKDIWPTFWEEARHQFNAEEMPSKYHSFVAVTAGMILATALLVIAKAIIIMATG